MNLKKNNYVLGIAFTLLSLINSFGCSKKSEDTFTPPKMDIKIPTEGNTWFLVNTGGNETYSDFNKSKWSSTGQVVRTFFWIKQAGTLDIGILAKTDDGTTTLIANFMGEEKEISISKQNYSNTYIGTYEIPSAGYYYLDIKGIDKKNLLFGDISNILLGGPAVSNGVYYSNEDYFYWGRRGPSVHFSYNIPGDAGEIQWFYNEAKVDEGNDIVGSYYMTNGFSEGYFGFQVNSTIERRILFSVWSPYSTDDPSSIPDDYKVELLKKGDNVTVNDFGNEGSGGQSYLKYNWVTGNTYKFLLKVEPQTDNKTDYTAWFYAPETGSWQLIASWRRPYTNTYAKGLYSFLENFDTNSGPLGREVSFGNQWVCDVNGNWFEITSAKFTADATARSNARLDYAGSVNNDNNCFVLKNCGFFSENTEIDKSFSRVANETVPEINFLILP